jgi:hypothetical protein
VRTLYAQEITIKKDVLQVRCESDNPKVISSKVALEYLILTKEYDLYQV